MSKVAIADKDTADLFFSIFDAAQGLERRVVRIISRGEFNRYSIDELVNQATGLRGDIDYLLEMAIEAEKMADADDEEADDAA